MRSFQRPLDEGSLARLVESYAELFALLDSIELRLSPQQCAPRLSLTSAGALERELKRRGLPRFRVLRDWYYVLRLHEQALGNASLSGLAAQRGDYASVLYRFVQRTTGRKWKHIAKLERSSMLALAMSAWRANGLLVE